MSPYLYVIWMERLAHLINKAIELGAWKPARASRNGPDISNLAFADDLILFAEATPDQANIVAACLDQFCEVSGSKVSCSKSRVFFSNNTAQNMREEICSNLNITETADLGRYLGVPTILGRASKKDYQFLVDRINGKLAGWKAKLFSMAGRATLIQSCLSSMPFYTMQTTRLPRSVCDMTGFREDFCGEVQKKSARFT